MISQYTKNQGNMVICQTVQQVDKRQIQQRGNLYSVLTEFAKKLIR